MPTTDELQAQINDLKDRLDLIDGNGLTIPNTAFIQVTGSRFAGQRADIQQLAMTMESIRAGLQGKMDQWIQTIKSALGLA